MVETTDIGKFSLTHWCQWNMQMQLSPQIIWYLFYGVRYCDRILMMIYVYMWNNKLNYI